MRLWHHMCDGCTGTHSGSSQISGASELTMDQLLFNRPIPGYAQYRSPVKGLYMCGSSTHPGGGVMGAPGANAARSVLQDLGLRGQE